MKIARLLLVIVGLVWAGAADARTPRNPALAPPVPYSRDSGVLGNASDSARTVGSEVVHVPGAAWLRIYFGKTTLGADSLLRITSEKDGEVQQLDAAALEMWSNTSAYFNGDTVTIELTAGPETMTNQLVIDRIAHAGGDDPEPLTLCGADDRYPTEEDWVGRLLPNACTGDVWSQRGCIMTAGHCGDSATEAQTIEFRVPRNNAQCQLQHPPVNDQFPILDRDFENFGSVDWTAAAVGTNGLGQTPFDRYGDYRPIATSIPGVGAAVSVTGYGTASECDLSQTQQMSVGNITGLTVDIVEYDSDTTGGNSGSSVVHDGKIIAVHAHGGCPFNNGTRVDRTNFALARVNLCYGTSGDIELDRPGYGCDNDVMTVTVFDSSLIGAGSVSIVVDSTTEPGGESVLLSEALPGMLVGTLPTFLGAPLPGDGVLSVTQGDTITAAYVDQDGGAGGNPIDRTTTASLDCVAPVIDAVAVGSVDVSSALVSWQTDEPADATVTYGTEPPGGQTISMTQPLATDHSILIDDLNACTEYFFSVSSEDASGNTAVDDNSGDYYSFATGCPLPPAVPDGSAGTTPMLLHFSPLANIMRLTWDNQCTATGPTKILYGPLDEVSTYGLTGAVCDISPDASIYAWTVLPGSYWVLMVKDDELQVEGSWGLAAAGERNGLVSSGMCGTVAKNPAGSCP